MLGFSSLLVASVTFWLWWFFGVAVDRNDANVTMSLLIIFNLTQTQARHAAPEQLTGYTLQTVGNTIQALPRSMGEAMKPRDTR